MTPEEYRRISAELQAQMLALKREFYAPYVAEYQRLKPKSISAFARERGLAVGGFKSELKRVGAYLPLTQSSRDS